MHQSAAGEPLDPVFQEKKVKKAKCGALSKNIPRKDLKNGWNGARDPPDKSYTPSLMYIKALG